MRTNMTQTNLVLEYILSLHNSLLFFQILFCEEEQNQIQYTQSLPNYSLPLVVETYYNYISKEYFSLDMRHIQYPFDVIEVLIHLQK